MPLRDRCYIYARQGRSAVAKEHGSFLSRELRPRQLRIFISSPLFHDLDDVEPALFQSLLIDDVALLKFAAHYLNQVLFGENTIPEKTEAIEKRIKRRKEITARQREELRKRREQRARRVGRASHEPHRAVFGRPFRNRG